MDRIVDLDGPSCPWRKARIPPLDRGVLFADGLYEVAAVLDGRLVDNARSRGAAVCTNRRTIKVSDFEGRKLATPRAQLMAAEVYAAFVRGLIAEVCLISADGHADAFPSGHAAWAAARIRARSDQKI